MYLDNEKLDKPDNAHWSKGYPKNQTLFSIFFGVKGWKSLVLQDPNTLHTVSNSFSINFNSGSFLTIYSLSGWCKEAIKDKKTKILRGNFEKNTIFNSGAIVFYLQVLDAIFILQVKMIQTSWLDIQTFPFFISLPL